MRAWQPRRRKLSIGRVGAPLIVLTLLLSAALACTRSSGEKVIYVTATPLRDDQGTIIVPPSMTPDRPTDTPLAPTPSTARYELNDGGSYAVQPGDTLGSIAAAYELTVDALMAANSLSNPDDLEVGQTLTVPGGMSAVTPDFKLIPDSELVYGPTASTFSLTAAVKFAPGFLRAYSEEVGDEVVSGVEIIAFVARSYSVNPRLLLALLEYRGEWLTNPYPYEQQMDYPMGLIKAGREGLLRQALDAADALNRGYYGWKYRGDLAMTFVGGPRVLFAPTLNAGTVGVQYMLAQTNSEAQWQRDVHPEGFFQTYMSLFGDPFKTARDPVTPPDLTQPKLTFPFAQGEEWVYTGGPHGAYNSGSAWGAIDLAPPEPPEELKQAQGACYISPNWVVAAADGIVARADEGHVVLDLDGDGDEHTGWNLVYMHIDTSERVKAGMPVRAGDRLGHPSCEGGVSTGTHLHLSRRYNGEWIPVDCEDCAPGATVPPFVLGEWTFIGFPGQEYQGYMTRPGDDGYRQAEQTRDYEFNKVTW